MTSIAFILGVVPLVTADGAGAASQQALGTVVFGGVLASTLLAIPFVPVFFIVLRRLGAARRRPCAGDAAAGRAAGDPAALTLRRNARRLTSPGSGGPRRSVVNWQDSVRAA